MRRGLGQIETTFFAYVQMRGQSVVRAGELTDALRLSAIQERKLLSRLARAGLIVRVWRGLYLVPLKLPLGGKWSPSEGLALEIDLMRVPSSRISNIVKQLGSSLKLAPWPYLG
jgi:hypothetical protein